MQIMHRDFNSNDENAMNELRNRIIESGNLEIPITLGEKKGSIRFIETHWLDIREILKNK